MKHTRARHLLAGLATLAFAACGTGSGVHEANSGDKPEMAGPKGAAKADAWHRLDDPSRLGENLVMRLEALPLDGEAAVIPWAGSYWPTYLDSINHRWDCPASSPNCDNLSPAEKYAKAFEIEGVEDYVSENHGVDAHPWKPACTQQSDCDDGYCAIRRGRTQGRCIPTWWGICHAWSPAAIAEPEPIRPLEINGVTFKINDLKALATYTYNFIHTKYVSLRCEVDGSTVATDEFGNPMGDDAPCKDTNPGTFHVIATNYLGLMSKSFVEDRTWDLEVWNQPVARYKINRQEDVTVALAHQLLDVPDDQASNAYLFNPDAVHLVMVEMDLDYVAESAVTTDGNLSGQIENYIHTDRYEYILELDAERNILGGEWVGASKTKHPDFLWVSTGFRIFQHYEPPIASWRVHAMMAAAARPEEPSTTEPEPETTPTTPTNENAAPLSVEAQVETGSTHRYGPYETTGGIKVALSGDGDADLYLRHEAEPTTDAYDCRPYTGSSQENCEHTGAGRYYVAVYGYATSNYTLTVTLTESTESTSAFEVTAPTEAGAAPNGITHESGEVAAGELRQFGPYTVEDSTLEISLSSCGNTSGTGDDCVSGDADLYVRRDAPPTLAEYDCRPYLPTSEESCTMAGPGTFYVLVSGYTETMFDLSVAY